MAMLLDALLDRLHLVLGRDALLGELDRLLVAEPSTTC